ncbi:MAG: hypothetical protein K6A40_04030 [Solobacterium sp.]|nr:hypothetical protein [Solobacterium sp.]
MKLLRTLNEIPASYFEEAKEQGILKRITYTKGTDTKYVTVYEPYGYDPAEEYDYVYMIHGGGGDPDSYYTGDGKPTGLKNILDNMIQNHDMDAKIIVTPTYYPENDKPIKTLPFPEQIPIMRDLTENFWKELIHEVIDAVEGDRKVSREHRAITGFSMGSVTTWSVLAHALAYFSTFIPMSGDSWAIDVKGGSDHSEETAKYLRDAVAEQNIPEYFIYAVTGDKDIACANLAPMIKAMKDLNDPIFAFTENDEEGNFAFFCKPDGVHAYKDITQYLYNVLPLI